METCSWQADVRKGPVQSTREPPSRVSSSDSSDSGPHLPRRSKVDAGEVLLRWTCRDALAWCPQRCGTRAGSGVGAFGGSRHSGRGCEPRGGALADGSCQLEANVQVVGNANHLIILEGIDHLPGGGQTAAKAAAPRVRQGRSALNPQLHRILHSATRYDPLPI